MARLTFYGAAREVTGSCHLLEAPAVGRVLLDCGMHQGGDAVDRNDGDFGFDPAAIDAVVLSHAHLDHSGLLPRLYHQGFRGPIHCTAATAELLEVMLKDAAGLYFRDLERSNLRNARRGLPEEPAAYEWDDVAAVLEACVGHRYREAMPLGPAATLRFHDAGHILGSAICELSFEEEDGPRRLVFSGDLGKHDSVLMREPERLSEADLVLLESTYGDREHKTEEDTLTELRDVLHDTWRRGGNVMIPSFAVGRAQEIIFHLGRLYSAGELDPWQVFLDSPMAIAVTRVYDHWLKLLDENSVRALSEPQRRSLETFLPTLRLTEDTDASMAINRIDRGALIIAGSGMCTGGRIRHHFKHRIWDARNTVIFVGFQAEGTLGRLIVDGVSPIRMFGEEFVVKANVATLGGLSAHAGQSGLVSWLGTFDPAPRTVLVHGEAGAQKALAARIRGELGIEAEIPGRYDSIDF
jgi:metallo-beta-lactamase family protein